MIVTYFGANENDRWTGEATARQLPKRKWLWPQIISLSLSFLTYFSLVLHFASTLVTTGRMRRYLQPIQVAQLVQLLQDGASIRAVAKRFSVSPSTVSRAWRRYQEMGHYTRMSCSESCLVFVRVSHVYYN